MSALSKMWRMQARIRVLVVSSDDEIRSLCREPFAAAGYEIIEANDGRQALVDAFIQTPSLIVTEQSLPDFDGCALCEVLRADAATRELPVLVIASGNCPADLDRARAAGANVVLIKPVASQTLASEVRRLLTPAPAPARGEAAAASTAFAAGVDGSERRRKSDVRAHLRCETTMPPERPPALYCPSCQGPLRYERSYVGGVNTRHAEQWDMFRCLLACGTFEYRQRTRRLRRVG